MTANELGIQRFSISAESRIPLYHQLFLVLKSKIDAGEYGAGDYLPSERELSTLFKVSRITTMRALNELEAGGLVVRETGRGTRVRFFGQGMVTRGAAGREDAPVWPEGAGGAIQIEVAGFGYEPASPAVAAALAIEAGAPVQQAVRILTLGREPFAQLTSFVAEAIGRQWRAEDLAARPLHQILSELGHSIERVDEGVTATLADMALSERLKVSVGAPLLKIERTTHAKSGRPVEHMIGLYRPDRYRYRVSLNDGGHAPPS